MLTKSLFLFIVYIICAENVPRRCKATKLPQAYGIRDKFTVENFQNFAQSRMAPDIWEYVYQGSDSGFTAKENIEAFKRLRIRPRHLRDIYKCSLRRIILKNITIDFPVALSPTAYHKLYSLEGEIGTAKAAAAMGTVMVLSSFSTTSIREIAEKVPSAQMLMQVYPNSDHKIIKRIIDEAERKGFKGIVLTIDSPVIGNKVDIKINNFQLPDNFDLPVIRRGLSYGTRTPDLVDVFDSTLSRTFTWQDIATIKNMTSLPIIAKGVLTAEDARLAVESGVDAILVSNHGGRQLDYDPASIEALPEIAAEVGSEIDIFIDGGIRSGGDVFKALALGAKAVFIGRPVVWGLFSAGEKGVARVLEILRNEFNRTLALTGCQTCDDITPQHVVKDSYYERIWDPVHLRRKHSKFNYLHNFI